MSFVLDASVAVAWAFVDENPGTVVSVLLRVQQEYAVAPALLPFEIASALDKARKEQRITPQQIASFLADIETLDIRVETHVVKVSTLMTTAERYNVSAYDAAYLALARKLNLPLATLDAKLAKAAQSAGVTLLIEVP